MELDDLKGQWQALGDRVDAAMHLDGQALKASLMGRTRSALRWDARLLSFDLTLNSLMLAGLAAFALRHWNQPSYLLPALPLLALWGYLVAAVLGQWTLLRRIRFDEPVLRIQAQLQAIRASRIRVGRLVLLSSGVFWVPWLIVLLRGLLGWEVYALFSPTFLLGNLAAGLALVPVMAWLGRASGPSHQGLGGWNLNAALQSLEALGDLEAAEDPGPRLAREATLREVRALLEGDLRRLTLRTFPIVPLLLIPTGLFMAAHGGQHRFVLPILPLQLFWAGLLGSGIHQLIALRSLDFAAPLEALRARLAALRQRRLRLHLAALLVAPPMTVPLLIVGLKAFAGIDAYRRLGLPGLLALLAASLAFSALGWARRKALLRWLDRRTGRRLAAALDHLGR